MSALEMRDVSRSRHELGRGHVTDLPAVASLGDIVRTRIRSEVAGYNAHPGPLFVGMIQPADSIRGRNGYRMQRPRRLDADRLIAAAEEAVSAQMLGFLVEGELVTDLDRTITVEEHDELVAVFQRPVVARTP